MPIKTTSLVFTGTQDSLTFYLSRGGRNLVRKKSSLNGARVRKDPAFKGFRNSCNRMRQASPIASALYAIVPMERREYSLYRLLTGAALKLLKQGMIVESVKEVLKKEYIDPLVTPASGKPSLVVALAEERSTFAFRPLHAVLPPLRRKHRARAINHSQSFSQVPKEMVNEHGVVYTIQAVDFPYRRTRRKPSAADPMGLTYLGRLSEAPKLKMYQRVSCRKVVSLTGKEPIQNVQVQPLLA